MWLDVDDDIWFFDLGTDQWGYICIWSIGGATVARNEVPGEEHGPYRELKR